MTSPARFTLTLEVVQTIRNGLTCAILVEGEERGSDAQILQIILKSVGQSVTFHGRDGRDNLIKELPDFVAMLPKAKVAAIVDCDFTDESEIERTYLPNYEGHIFYWRRYCIENYLLEPELIANCMMMTHSLAPENAPQSLMTAEAVEKFLLDWCRRLAPQVAGNWTIHDLTQESDQQGLNVEALSYFRDVTDRDAAWVLSELDRRCSGWSVAYPKLFSKDALRERFEDKHKRVLGKIETLSEAHRLMDGKRFLKPALNRELPGNLRPYFFNLLAEAASKNVPGDIHTLVEDRILPRWRQARNLGQE